MLILLSLRLHNGRIRKELDAAVVLASLGCTVQNPLKSTGISKNHRGSDKNNKEYNTWNVR